MLHELKNIVEAAQEALSSGLQTALVTVVALEGSSYRRPGVRMLVIESGAMVGAVSGGCVEKEIMRQAQSVFQTGQPKTMTYDGRLRLGCEGILTLLIEPFAPTDSFFESFDGYLTARQPVTITTYYHPEVGSTQGGSLVHFSTSNPTPVRSSAEPVQWATQGLTFFKNTLAPSLRLWIIGAEHDSVALCQLASLSGWEVTVVAAPDEQKTAADFPGVSHFKPISAEALALENTDSETAVVLMTHSLVKDVKYLGALLDRPLGYLGMLGPKRRRERIISEMLEYHPEVTPEFLEQIHGPSGLDVGAETAQEIAISILAEIMAVLRQRSPIHLREKSQGIHQ